MPNHKNYRKRPQTEVYTDIAWLEGARELLRTATDASFPPGPWPLRADPMDRVLKALGTLQAVIHGAIEEAHQEQGTKSSKPVWLGYPPPRR